MPKFVLPKLVTHFVLMIDGEKITIHKTTADGFSVSAELEAIDWKYPRHGASHTRGRRQGYDGYAQI